MLLPGRICFHSKHLCIFTAICYYRVNLSQAFRRVQDGLAQFEALCAYNGPDFYYLERDDKLLFVLVIYSPALLIDT
jgi:dihydroorotase